MKPTNEQLEAYKAMAAASPDSMKAKIEANLRATCDKFAGHDDRLEDCMKYLTECAREILDGKNGEVDDDTCYRICRDYFNDEIWKAEDEENERKKAEEEERAKEKEKAQKEKKAPEKSAKTKKKAPAKPTNLASEPEPEKDGTEKPVAVVPEEPEKKFQVCPECGEECLYLFKGVRIECHHKLCKSEEAKMEKIFAERETVADRNRLIIEENNKKLGIGLAETIDLFGTGK